MGTQGYAPHEGLFLKVFRDKDNTKHFLKKHLSLDILKHIDLDTLYLENVSFLDDNLRKHFSDLVFSVMVGQDEYPKAKVYLLFEHKSSPESLVGMQVLRYMALQWKELYDQGHVRGGKLPPIIPIVIYQGRGFWQARASFQDIVDIPSNAFKAVVPDFTFAFFNVRTVDEQKVQENVVLKFYVAMIKSLDLPGLKELLPQLTQGLYESLETRTALEYIEIFFKYLTKATDKVDQDDYKRALKILPEGGENIMNTLAEQWIREGEQRGEQRGELRGEIKGQQDMLITAVQEKFGTVHPEIVNKIRSIQSKETIQGLFRDVFRLGNFQEFSRELDKVV